MVLDMRCVSSLCRFGAMLMNAGKGRLNENAEVGSPCRKSATRGPWSLRPILGFAPAGVVH